MSIMTPHDFHVYAGAFTVAASAVPQFPAGSDVEFARYGGPDVYVYDVESGAELVVPAAELTVDDLGAGRWRVRRQGPMLLEIGPMPPDFRPRDFAPPPGYGFVTRFIRPRVPWPRGPRWVTLPELLTVLDTARWTCFVCGYPDLTDDPETPAFEFCPCCGIQFGYTDQAGGDPAAREAKLARWRADWIAGGMTWNGFSPPPPGWDPVGQVRRLSPDQ